MKLAPVLAITAALLAPVVARADQVIWSRYDSLRDLTVSLSVDKAGRMACRGCSPPQAANDDLRPYPITSFVNKGPEPTGLEPWFSSTWVILFAQLGGSHCGGNWYVVDLLEHSLRQLPTVECMGYTAAMQDASDGHPGTVIALTPFKGNRVTYRAGH